MNLMQLPSEVIASLVDQMVVVTTRANLFDSLQLRLVNRLFDEEVLRAFYKTELVNFHSDSNFPRARRMGTADLARLLEGRVAGPNQCMNAFVQELQDGIGELTKMDERAFGGSIHLDPGRIQIMSRREARRIPVERLLILQAVATVMHSFSFCVVLQLLGPDNPKSPGRDWALLTAALLGDAPTIQALLGRSWNTNRPECILNRGLEIAASHGNFDAVVAFLDANVDPNGRGFCKGYPGGHSALGQACVAGHENVVILLLEPGRGVKRTGSAYEDAVLGAARGRRDEDHGHVEILQLLLDEAQFANLGRIRRNILGEACFWGREDVVYMVLKRLVSIRYLWRGRTPLDVATSRGHKSIVQLLLEHGPKPDW